MSQELSTIPVHVVGDDTKPSATHLDDRTYTILIDTANPISVVLPKDVTREYAVLQALDNQVVLCTSLSDAQQVANTAAGLPAPVGSALAVGIAVPCRGTNQMWVTAAAVPSRVSVIAGYRVG